MAFEADALIDRRRLVRRLARWRGLAVAALAAAALAAFGRFETFSDGGYVARYDVSGVIADDRRHGAILARIARDDDARALIVHVNSRGGSVVGGEALYRALRRTARDKPVVAVMGEVAASAAYLAAIAADRVLAREGTLTGSIGVILQTAEITELLQKLGITVEEIRSGPLKSVPSPLLPMTEDARATLQDVIDDAHRVFLDRVAERRRLTEQALERAADGRIYSGRRALRAGLVDGIGGEAEARQWLADERGVAAALPMRDVGRRSDVVRLLRLTTLFGEKAALSERFILDGLVSVWHPSLN